MRRDDLRNLVVAAQTADETHFGVSADCYATEECKATTTSQFHSAVADLVRSYARPPRLQPMKPDLAAASVALAEWIWIGQTGKWWL